MRFTILYRILSLAEIWRLEKHELFEGLDIESFWNQEIMHRDISLSGLDFVHRYDNSVLKWEALFSLSIGGREIFFQRLWKDLEHAEKNKTRNHLDIVEKLLLGAPSDLTGISNGFVAETATREVLKLVVDCGFRPSYLSYGPLMDVLECGAENVEPRMRQL